MSSNEATIAYLAGQFADVVHEWTTPAEFKEIKKLNAAETDSDVCHTHDFFDANEAMDAAFRRAFGRSCHLPCDVDEGVCSQAEADADMALWNAAWSQAKTGWLS